MSIHASHNRRQLHGRRASALQQLSARRPLRALVALVGVIAMLLGGLSQSAIANAAGTSPFLRISKTVDGLASETLAPGQSFTYGIKLDCSEQNCVNATMTDPLPSSLHGFGITGVQITPSSAGGVATWSEGGQSTSQPTTVGANTVLSVAFNQGFSGGKGLSVGNTAYVNITLQVPSDFSPADPRNNTTITNTATSKADNSLDGTSSADITVKVDQKVDAGITKSWSPSTDTFNPGNPSTVTLKSTNTSNVTVDKLVVQDPQSSTASEGATTLDANNPFRTNDFQGFGTASMPTGATAVQVDAYVYSNGAWHWVTGTPGATYALPSGVTAAQVGGLRFTYTGSIAVNASDNVQLKLTQRSTDRNDNTDLSKATSTITNVAQAQATKGTTSSAVKTATGTYTVTPASIGTNVTKSFSPNSIPAGNTTVGSITATNTQTPVKTLKISDKTGFFNDTTTFGGFTTAITYPLNATSGTVVYHMLDGSADQPVSFANNTVPTSPTAKISGFDVIFDSTANDIIQNAQTTVKFTVATSSSVFTNSSLNSLSSTNTATSTVTAANGQTASNSSSADLTIVKPAIHVTLAKSIQPANNVQPGQGVVAKLASTTDASSDYVKPTTIVVEDSWGALNSSKATGFWNAFNLASIQPTQVPVNASLTVEVQRSDGTWITLDTQASQTKSWLYQLSATALANKLPTGVTADTLTGIRFTFVAPSAAPFPASTTVTPYVGFTASGTKRDGTGRTDTVDGTTGNAPQSSTQYTNTAVTTGSGTTNDGMSVKGTANATAPAGVIVYPGTQTGVYINKAWDKPSVASQSGATATTHLNWRVLGGIQQATITDPNANQADTANTVFDAFNLTQISPVALSNTPYTNGWYLKYDTIQAIKLYYNGTWNTVTAPGGSWQNADGSFKGYTLSATEQGYTTGVQIVMVPNDSARTTALNNGSDPYAPAPASGVVSSSGDRTFDLVWQLRNKTRSANSFVTGGSQLNGGKGTVDNTVGIEGITYQGATQTASADAFISIIDQPPAVSVSKTVNSTSAVQVPAPGIVTDSQYPTLTYTLTAQNTSTTRASYVRVTDPTPCTTTGLTSCQTLGTDASSNTAGALADPFSGNSDVRAGLLDTTGTPNPFNRQNLTKVVIAASQANEVDLGKTTVWLLHYKPGANGVGTYTETSATATAVNAMTAAQLADVVGISATFQGTDPANNGGSISQGNLLTVTLGTQVRSTLRTTGAQFVPRNISGDPYDYMSSTNRVFAQSYDPVTAPTTATGDVSSATVNYTRGTVDVSTAKTITPGTITVVKPKTPQTVTLTANQGASTVSPVKVTLTDQSDGGNGSTNSTNFWANFDFTGLTGITFPAGATRVVVSAYGPFGANGALAWVDGAAQPNTAGTYTVPVTSAQYSNIQGLKFTFSKPDGSIFSAINMPNWNAKVTYTAVLRDTVRGSATPVTFPGSATDLVSAQSDGALDSSGVKTATAPVAWTPGTALLAINKLANDGVRSASVGSMVPWNITITNKGTGYLDLTTVTDTLPAALKYTGSGSPSDPSHPVVFTPGTLTGGGSGTLITAPTVNSSDPTKVVFTWPSGQNRLQPGETVVIRVWLELQPGPQAGEKVTNTVSVQTAQKLDGVSNAIANNGAGAVTGIDASGNTPTTGDPTTGAATSDYVSPTVGENLYVVKGVSGSLPGAVNTLDSTQNCTPTLQAAGGTQLYYRSPCAANSTINGTDSWLLKAVNAGTTNITRAQFFEQLPVAGDKYLVDSTASRGSAYRPQLTGAPQIAGAPAGTTVTIQATTDANACVGTWSTIPAATDACNANSWIDQSKVSDWSKVTAIRVTLDFTTSAAKALTPGQEADVTYSSKNVAASSSDTGGASVDVASSGQYAWNQFGLLYTGVSGARTIAPSLVGVHLRTGSIQVAKALAGAAAAYAPSAFTATVSCATGDGTPITFNGAASKQVTLSKQADGSYAPVRISGIPLSANANPTTCTVAEDRSTGSFGETSRSIDRGTTTTPVVINQADTVASNGTPTSAVPAAQIATITNTYDYTGLTVTKKVDTLAKAGSFGTFSFSLACRTSDGQTVKFGNADSTSFTIARDATWSAPANTIPANSTCTLTETDSKGAASTVYTGDGVTGGAGGTAALQLTASTSKIVATTVTNHFDAGTLTVVKKVTGTGAATYGNGPFTFSAVCTYTPGGVSAAGGTPATGASTATGSPTPTDTAQQLLNTTFELASNGSKTFGVFPVGTQCVVKETDAKGATSTSMAPSGGTVTIAKQTTASAASNVTVTATNTYTVGGLTIIKKRVGAGAAARGSGPFEALVSCTYHSGANTLNVPLPNNGKVVLSAANGYRTTLNGILLGATCRVVETKKGGADSSSMNPGNGVVVIAADGTKNTVTITNLFGAVPQSLGATGSSVAFAVGLALLAAVGGCVLILVRRRGDPRSGPRHTNSAR